ncbi:MAG: PEBP family protein [Pseudomonadota bacterium]
MKRSLSALVASIALSSPVLAESYSVDVWADNWFEMRVDGVRAAEDSVPITTERSFNRESFSFTAEPPFVIGLVAKDFIENDTGLEYIGTSRQQMGDGGVILQVRNSIGEVVAVSDTTWQCRVIHTAPLDKSCAKVGKPIAGEGPCGFEIFGEPRGWDKADFDALGWMPASAYSVNQVDPKGGYDEVDWAEGAELIWGPDLEQSNTVLCRYTVE